MKLKDSFSRSIEIHFSSVPGNYKKLVKGINNLSRVVYDETNVVMYTHEPIKVVKALLSKLGRSRERIVDLQVRKPSLTDVFQHLTKDGRQK